MRFTQGSRQTVSSELTPREFHPNWRSARAALIACDGFITLGLWLDGSIIILFVGYGEIGSCPIFWVGSYRSLPYGRSWRTSRHAYAYHNHKEKVFGEWLFDWQGTILFSPHKGKQVKGFWYPFTCLLTKKGIGVVLILKNSKIFFELFNSNINTKLDCSFRTAL